MTPFSAFSNAAWALNLMVRAAVTDDQAWIAYNADDKICGAFSKPWTSGMRDTFWLGGAAYDTEEEAIAVLVSGRQR